MGSRGRWKVWLPVLVLVMLALKAPVPAQAEWVQDKFGWQYQNEDGSSLAACWKEIDGVWYYFKETGYMADSPMKLEGVQYYFKKSGAMAAEEWIEFRGKQYYFQKDGSLARSCWIDELYYVDKHGAMVTDKRIDGIYIDEDGVAEHPEDHFFD